MLVRRQIIRAALLTATLALTGCRYGFSGGGLPPGVKTIAIIPFENETASSELPRELTDALREGVEKRLGLRAATEEKADAILRGKVVTYEPDFAVAVSADRRQSTSARRRVRISLDVQLVRQSDGTILWQKAGLSADGEYAEGGEVTGRKQAIERIVADIIEGAQSRW